MLILEEWINCVRDFFSEISDKLINPLDIFNEIKKMAKELDPKELEEYVGAREKISLFLNHYRGFEKLPSESREKRLNNSFIMLKKMEEEYLFPSKINKKTDNGALNETLKNVKGVGPKRAKKFEQLNLKVVRDLLFYFPRNYDDRRKVLPIAKITPADRVTVIGEIHSLSATKTRTRMNILTIQLVDDTGVLVLKWFNQPYLNKLFHEVG
jgi:ATP-dependent DNA helicase RecG